VGVPRRLIAVLAAACVVALINPWQAQADDLATTAAGHVRAGLAAGCRGVLAVDGETCRPIDGRPVSEARVAAYEGSWVHRALTLQRTLDDGAPLLEAQLGHTHNSFNSSFYAPTLTNQDPNQVYSLTDQLRMDVRAVELDLHWVPSAYGSAATGGRWVTLCHGSSQDQLGGGDATIHVGCSIDRPFQQGLDELATWLRANPHEVVLLYLENQMNGDPAAHAVAGDLITEHLGALVMPTPAGSDCAPMPVTTSRAAIRSAGRQVLIVGNCDAGAGTSWGRVVHERGPAWDEHGDPDGYGAVQCAEDRAAKLAGGSFRRYFEDSTFVAAAAGSNPVTSSLGGTSTLTLDAVTQMVRCGANIIGLDQLTPEDPRLAALVWSWAPGDSLAGPCTLSGADGRFHSDGCTPKRRFACADGAGGWHVTAASGRSDQGAKACAKQGWRFAAPANGLRNQLLIEAKSAAGATEVWLAT
jgi:hypothetical protein